MCNQNLISQYRELDKECALLYKYIHGYLEDEGKYFIPDKKTMDEVWEKWNELKAKVEALEEEDKVFTLVKHNLVDFIDSLKYDIEDADKHPEEKLMRYNWSMEHMSRISRDSDEEKCNKLIAQLDQLKDVHQQILDLILEKSDEKTLAAIATDFRREKLSVEKELANVKMYFPNFTQELLDKYTARVKEHCELLSQIADKISTQEVSEEELVKDDLSRTVKMDEQEYRDILGKKLGVSLDELIQWHKSEIEKTRAEVFSIASKLDIPDEKPTTMRQVNDILFKYEGPCDSAQEMLDRANEYLKRTRALAHEFVNLPDDEYCICAPISQVCKDSYPWGGYEGGDFSIRPFRGQMFLNNYNYENITDGWIKLNSLHEAYPGHHVQYVKTAISNTPEVVKIGAKYIPILEGTCLRTERAFEWIFGEDQFFPLFVAYRRHHGAVRIYVDLMLFYYGATIEDVIKIYEEELGFERGTARKQVQAHQNTPGYFTCYYYGMRKLCQWEKEYNFNKKDYTELLFSAGYIAIERFEELLKLTPCERERYFNDFCSLLKEDFKYEK